MNAPFFDVLWSRGWSRRRHVRWPGAILFLLGMSAGWVCSLPGLAQAPVVAPATAAPAPTQIVAPPVQTTAPAAVRAGGTQADAAGSDTNRSGAQDQAARAAANSAAAVNQQNNTLPDQVTEFQQLVSVTAGRILPIFGASLFANVPSTFAPVTDIPVGSNYVIGPGDEIAIQLSGQVNQQFDLTVDRTGAISVPGLGAVHIAGVPARELNTFLHNQFSRLYRNFTLNANLGSLRTIQVFVVGEARRPGSYSVSSLSTLLNAIFASGGPLPDGSLRDIQVKRDGKTLVHFDLYDLLLRGDKSNDVRLVSGDVIFIPFVGPQAAISGSVNTPAIYELKGSTSIRDLIQLAGGETAVAGEGGLRLERVYEHSMRSVEDVNLATGGAQRVQNGDILSVLSIVDRFRNAVTLRGNVASPGRFVWHPGMRVSDLIPNKASLITRNYWNKQNQLGAFVQDYLPNSNILPQAGQGALQLRSAARAQENTPAPQQAGASGTATTGNNSGTGTGDTQRETIATTSRNNGGAEAGGNSVGTALTENSSNFPAQNDVILSAPDIDWSYAVIQRLGSDNLRTTLISFDLGKLVLDGDASQNLELLPNDVVTIFSTADIRVPTLQQTRYVRLEGEFVAAGVYSVLPGETLRSLLRRAGGFTSEAYLYASEFTRESTRRVEAQRLQEYADQLDAQISAVTANTTARAISSSDQTAAAASEADARNAVSRLRRVTPSGRIVLDLRPNSFTVDTLPDLALEDGDRFVVPRVPSNITVQGQVYNANAFVYTPHQRMAEYLRRAGGPDREADKKREFILRADGSVISQQYTDIKRAAVFPGDTLVIPPVIDRRGLFQRVVDVAGIVNGFGLSAATLYLFTR